MHIARICNYTALQRHASTLTRPYERSLIRTDKLSHTAVVDHVDDPIRTELAHPVAQRGQVGGDAGRAGAADDQSWAVGREARHRGRGLRRQRQSLRRKGDGTGLRGLADRVEALQLSGPEIEAELRHRLAPALQSQADTLVLGCTHYPFLRATIEAISGSRFHILEPSFAVAAQVHRRLDQANCLHGLECT